VVNWREQGINITSRWIDNWGRGRLSKHEQTQHWDHIFEDIQNCDIFVLYAEKGETQKGALAEWGIAFALRKKLYYVGPKDEKILTGLEHEKVFNFNNLEEVFQSILN
jgi:hypothetical protein